MLYNTLPEQGAIEKRYITLYYVVYWLVMIRFIIYEEKKMHNVIMTCSSVIKTGNSSHLLMGEMGGTECISRLLSCLYQTPEVTALH